MAFLHLLCVLRIGPTPCMRDTDSLSEHLVSGELTSQIDVDWARYYSSNDAEPNHPNV